MAAEQQKVTLTRLDNFTRVGFDEQLPAVQMSEHNLEATKGLGEGQGVLVEEVIALSLELGMLLLLKDEDYVASDGIRLYNTSKKLVKTVDTDITPQLSTVVTHIPLHQLRLGR